MQKELAKMDEILYYLKSNYQMIRIEGENEFCYDGGFLRVTFAPNAGLIFLEWAETSEMASKNLYEDIGCYQADDENVLKYIVEDMGIEEE